MRLSEWFKLETSPDQRTFAEQIGVHPISICKYATGRMVPRPGVAERIQQATGGQVTIADFAQAFMERRNGSAFTAAQPEAA